MTAKTILLSVVLLLICSSAECGRRILLLKQEQPVAVAGCSTTQDSVTGATTTDSSLGGFNGSFADNYIAEPFTAGATYTVCSSTAKMKKVGSPTFNVTLGVYTDSSGSPGSIVGNVSDGVSSSTFDPTESDITFPNISASIVSGTTYWIVLHAVSSPNDGANYVRWRGFSAAINLKQSSTGSGGSWQLRDTGTKTVWSLKSN